MRLILLESHATISVPIREAILQSRINSPAAMVPLIEGANEPISAAILAQGELQLPLDSISIDAPQIQKADKLVEIGMIAPAAIHQKQDNPGNFMLDLVQAMDIRLQAANDKLFLGRRRRRRRPSRRRPEARWQLDSGWWIGWRLWFRWLGWHVKI
jgi:hypothetical protein